MKKELSEMGFYIAPALEIMSVKTEYGFASSEIIYGDYGDAGQDVEDTDYGRF